MWKQGTALLNGWSGEALLKVYLNRGLNVMRNDTMRWYHHYLGEQHFRERDQKSLKLKCARIVKKTTPRLMGKKRVGRQGIRMPDDIGLSKPLKGFLFRVKWKTAESFWAQEWYYLTFGLKRSSGWVWLWLRSWDGKRMWERGNRSCKTVSLLTNDPSEIQCWLAKGW